MLKAIIFDFDGVICESVDAKVEAFRRLFESYPRELPQILEYHVRNGGISRYEKFKVIYRDFLKKELSEAESKRLGQQFADFCYQMVIEAPLVKGVQEFLDKHHTTIHLFIASGTPHEEMVSIVKAKKLEKYFKTVYGSPASKHDIIRNILRDHRLVSSDVIFLGDSINDYEGAKLAGVKFLGRVRKGDRDPFKGTEADAVVENLEEFSAWLKRKKLI